MARAFQPSCKGQSSVTQAARVHESHGERDSQRLFRRHGLKLNIPTSTLRVDAGDTNADPVDISLLKLTDTFQVLLNQHPRLLFGGLPKGPEAETLCDVFWERFQYYHGSHIVYEHYSREERRRILPIAFHGDKGRGYQKAPVFVFDWETVFALPEKFRRAGSKSKREIADQKKKVYGGRLAWTCSQRAAGCAKHCPEPAVPEGHCSVGSAETPLLEAMGHNGKGNSLFSRYLVACIPKKVLSQNDAIVPTLLTEVAQNLQALFFNGIQDRDGVTYRAAFIGCKGDFEFLQLDAGSFDRTYLNEGRVRHRQMCPECWAGLAEYPSTDMSDRPKWVDSLYKDDPWSAEPPLNLAPYASSRKASLYKRDCFHMLKYGFARDLCGSVLFLLSWLCYFDYEGVQSKSIDNRLDRAHSLFSMWCMAESKCSTIKRFTPSNLHRKNAGQFPWLGGKGSDTVLVMMFLDFFVLQCLQSLRHPSHQVVLQAMHQTIRGGLDFMGVLHSHPLFLTPSCASFMHRSGLKLLRGYHFLAAHSLEHGYHLFSLRPKCHYFHHTLWELGLQISENHPFALSAAIWNCESNEDFVGRLSRLSRRVSPKKCGERVIDRYLVATKLLFRRAGV